MRDAVLPVPGPGAAGGHTPIPLIQSSAVHTGLTEHPAAELDRLVDTLVR